MPRVISLTVGNGPKKGSLNFQSLLPFKTPALLDFYKVADSKFFGPHIMATQRASIDNKNGLTDLTEYITRVWMPTGATEGESNHAVYGGLYRNRPTKRAPLTGSGTVGTVGGWQYQDKERQFAGVVNGFWNCAFIDVLGSDTFPHVKEWAAVANLTYGWKDRLIFMPDASVSIVRNGPTNLKNYTVQAFTDPNGGPAWKKHTDGRRLVVPYGPEFCLGDPTGKDPTTGAYLISTEQVVQYWLSYCQQMDAAGYPIALGCMFSRAWRDANSKTAVAMTDSRLAPWVVYLGRWGVRSPGGVAGVGNDGYSAAIYSRTPKPNGYGLPYIDTIAVEDTRPNQGKYSEAMGWKLLWDFYNRAEATKPEALQLATANDFAEGTAIFDSELWGLSAMDVCTYFNIRYGTGSFPEIDKDACYLAYRIHNVPELGTQPTYSHPATTYTKKMVRTDTSPGVNNVYVLVFATAPAVIRATIGGTTEPDQSVPAGLTQVSFPMRNGTISVKMFRNSVYVPNTQVDSLPGQNININTQVVQDLVYRRASSLRQAA